MRKHIKITSEESKHIENLFEHYNSYMNVLYYLTGADTPKSQFLDHKWNEAVELYKELEQAKRAAERKYKPEGTWENFEFDFENNEIIFTRKD